MLALFIGWLALLLLGMPVGFSLVMISVAYLFFSDIGLIFATQRMVAGLNTFPLLAVPFFVMTGIAMNKAGVTERIFDFAKAMVGHVTGSLGHVNIMASLLFSGMSGSALADAGGLGQLEIKSMRDGGYDDDFAGGITAASSIIGPLVPPSIPLVIYGVVSGSSIGALFIAGLIPGLLCALSLMVMVYFIAKKRGYAVEKKQGLRTRLKAGKGAFLALMTPTIIVGGIFSGVFTPTEAAVVAAVYALILGGFVYRTIKIPDLVDIFRETVGTTAVVALMVMGVSLFGFVIAMEELPKQVATYFLAMSENKWAFLIMINLMLLFLGTFIESLALLLLVVPILVPVAAAFGIDPIHFGVMVMLNLMIGILTPPMGMALFVVAKVGNMPFHTLTRGVLPFLIPLFIVLILIAVFPQLTLFLPNLLLG